LLDQLAVEGREEANKVAALWAETTHRYNTRRQQENREAWHAYHLAQAERLEATASELASRHRSKAQALLEEA
jgi:hypothetical protein